MSRGDTHPSETHCKLRSSAAVGQASPHPLLVPRSGTDYMRQSPFGELYGVEVAHVPTAALLRSLQWVSLYRSRSAEPAAHTQSAGRSWVRGYGGTSKKIKQTLFSYKTATLVTSFNWYCNVIHLLCCLISFDTHIHFVRYKHSHRSI